MVPVTDRLRSVRRLVGGTPLLAIECRRDGGAPFTIHAKAEHLNLTGSIKDRAAVEAILGRTRAGGYGVRSLVRELVQSELFRRK